MAINERFVRNKLNNWITQNKHFGDGVYDWQGKSEELIIEYGFV